MQLIKKNLIKYKKSSNEGFENFPAIISGGAGADSLPIGAEILIDNDAEVPNGWEVVDEKYDASEVYLANGQSVQEALENGVSGGVTSWNNLEDRPFYDEGTVEILPLVDLIQSNPTLYVWPNLIENIQVGEAYIVNYNGINYNCVAESLTFDGLEGFALGNLSSIGGNSAGEPFGLAIATPESAAERGVGLMLLTLDNASSVSLSIIQNGIKKLDNKYLDILDEERVYVLPETSITIDYDGVSSDLDNVQLTLTEGTIYDVNFDGITYSCQCNKIYSDGISVYYIGSQWVYGDDYPFFIATDNNRNNIMYGSAEQNITTLSISYINQKVKQHDLPQHLQFGKESIVELLPLTEFTKDVDDAFVNYDHIEGLVDGDSYVINYNGKNYTTKARLEIDSDGWYIYFLGNYALFLEEGNTGEPFVLGHVVNNKNGENHHETQLIPIIPTSTVTVSIKKISVDSIKKKYLPKCLQFGETEPEAQVLINDIVSYDDDIFGNPCLYNYLMTPLIEGLTYKVIIGGSSYNCIARSSRYGDIYVGNQSLVGWDFDEIIESDEPFFIATWDYGAGSVICVKNGYDHGYVKMTTLAPSKIIPLDKKYLPQLVGESVEGNVFYIDEDEYVAEKGAEIFNSYKELNDEDYNKNIAIGYCSHAEGSNTLAHGTVTHAEGLGTEALGDVSHTEGFKTMTTGSYAHAEGKSTQADGEASHAEGCDTSAVSSYSHAEGFETWAEGDASHAEGNGSRTMGSYAHAEGCHSLAKGFASHAEGMWTTAYGDYQHAEGKYNIPDEEERYAHIVGNGDYVNRQYIYSNAHTLDWEGNAWFAGKVFVGGTSMDDAIELGAGAGGGSDSIPTSAGVYFEGEDNAIPYGYEIDDAPFCNPNLLINGDFQVWQRGESFTYTGEITTSPVIYTADRWAFVGSTGSTISKNDKLMHIESNFRLYQILENNLLDKTVTASIKYRLNGQSDFVTLSGTTIVSDESTGVPFVFDNNVGFAIGSAPGANTTLLMIGCISGAINIDIEYIKLEMGELATPLSPRSYAEELMMCQRYYERINLLNWQHFTNSIACSSSTNDISFNIPFKVQKRLSPSMNVNGVFRILFYTTWWDITIESTNTSTDIIKVNGTFDTSAPRINGSCGAISVVNLNNSSPYIELDAEFY